MKLLTLVCLLLTSSIQQGTKESINQEVGKIDSNPNLVIQVLDANEVYDQVTDGGGSIMLYSINDELVKIEQWIGLSFGAIIQTYYFKNGVPIKIIEEEQNFPFDLEEQTMDHYVLVDVFKAEVYIYDWDNDKTEVIQSGERNVSEGTCGLFEYEPEIEFLRSLFKK